MNIRTTLSSKGQLVVPKAVREARGWAAGTVLEFVDKGDDVVVRQVQRADPRFPSITWEEFEKYRIKHTGPSISTDDMDRAVRERAKRRWNAASG